MNISRLVRRIILFSLALACLCAVIAAQEKPARGEDPFQNEAWNKADNNFVEKHSKGPASEGAEMTTRKVRFIYLVPSDRSVRPDYKAAIADAALQLQDFYQKELGGNYAFQLNDPIVEAYQTGHTASWYQTNNVGGGAAGWFWINVLGDGFAATGGGFNDPDNRWIYYIDAEPSCTQYTGGTQGVAMMPSGDLRGLNGESNINPCGGPPADTAGKHRWIGGGGHEVGHAFDLPHPPGCGSPGPWSGCTGGQLASDSIMWLGFRTYPATYFLTQDKTALLAFTGFFPVQDLREPRFVDFDNDRRSDLSVWRPSNGNWYINASTAGPTTVNWGSSGDKIVPGDYDGDRKTDVAVWRPSDQTWYILNSSNSTYTYAVYGSNGDIPAAADYDGDRITDTAVWRPGTGTWYINRSASGTQWVLAFGTSGDRPVVADYNGDKRADIAVFRPSDTNWYIYQNYLNYYYYTNPPGSGNLIYSVTNFGLSGDNNVPADYDGDGKDDMAVWRPSTGTWYYRASSNGISFQDTIGQNGDIPVPGDYDNDDKTDFAVWRPSRGYYWFIHPSGGGRGTKPQWGTSGDNPVESAYVR